MTDPNPREPCVCGHVYAHHNALSLVTGTECTWRGCGCPRFIQETDTTGIFEQASWRI